MLCCKKERGIHEVTELIFANQLEQCLTGVNAILYTKCLIKLNGSFKNWFLFFTPS